MTTTTTERAWISSAAAARILECRPEHLPTLAARGLIGQRYLPGVRGRWSRRDVERLRDLCELPAGGRENPCTT